MTTRGARMIGLAVLLAAGAAFALMRPQPEAIEGPEPRVITPGPCPGAPCEAPSDALVLFDGTNIDQWTTTEGKPAGWKVEGQGGGAMTIAPGSGSIITKKTFGDCQVHLEFATPAPASGEGQGRGNSGVYLQGRYEVQVLDSYKSSTYPDGQCGAIYKQHAPLVNACRPPGQWQTYDIIFRAARFDSGRVTEPTQITVLHNGVLIQDHAVVRGQTGAAPGKEEPGDGPIYLQDHGNPMKYRNIWVRDLK